VLDGPNAYLAACVQSQFGQDAADVVFDSPFADDQRLGDLAVALTADDQHGHLTLAGTHRPDIPMVLARWCRLRQAVGPGQPA